MKRWGERERNTQRKFSVAPIRGEKYAGCVDFDTDPLGVPLLTKTCPLLS